MFARKIHKCRKPQIWEISCKLSVSTATFFGGERTFYEIAEVKFSYRIYLLGHQNNFDVLWLQVELIKFIKTCQNTLETGKALWRVEW